MPMTVRLIGAILIVFGCGCVGFAMAGSYRRELTLLKDLHTALLFMHSELSCRLTPLPELFSLVCRSVDGRIGEVFSTLSQQMHRQVSPDASCCMRVVLQTAKDLPSSVFMCLQSLGRCLGGFDLQGQLMQLEAVINTCSRYLTELNQQKEDRIRQYQTLGICAGVTLAILLI